MTMSVMKALRLTTLSFAIGLTFLPAIGAAAPYWDRRIYYYDSPEHSNLVGIYIFNCGHQSSMEGVETPWFDVEQTKCDPLEPDH